MVALLRTARIAAVHAEEQQPRVQRGKDGTWRDGGAQGTALERAWLFAPPWRHRLLDGSLAGEFGPSNRAAAWERYESRRGWAPWDPPPPAPRPQPVEMLTAAAFLRRFGHTLPDVVVMVATAEFLGGVRGCNALAHRLGMKRAEVQAAQRVFSVAWFEAMDRLEARDGLAGLLLTTGLTRDTL